MIDAEGRGGDRGSRRRRPAHRRSRWRWLPFHPGCPVSRVRGRRPLTGRFPFGVDASEDSWLDGTALSPSRLPRQCSSALACFARSIKPKIRFFCCAPICERISVFGSNGAPTRSRAACATSPASKGVVNRILHEQARTGRPDFALAVEDSPRSFAGGVVETGAAESAGRQLIAGQLVGTAGEVRRQLDRAGEGEP